MSPEADRVSHSVVAKRKKKKKTTLYDGRGSYFIFFFIYIIIIILIIPMMSVATKAKNHSEFSPFILPEQSFWPHGFYSTEISKKKSSFRVES